MSEGITVNEKHYAHLALLGIGAVVVLWYLTRGSSNPVAASGVTPVGSSLPSYPNAAPIKLGDVTIEGSPTNLTYNQLPPSDRIAVSDGSASGCGCDSIPGQPVTVQRITAPTLQAASDNFASYAAKATAAPAPAPPRSGWALVSH